MHSLQGRGSSRFFLPRLFGSIFFPIFRVGDLLFFPPSFIALCEKAVFVAFTLAFRGFVLYSYLGQHNLVFLYHQFLLYGGALARDLVSHSAHL